MTDLTKIHAIVDPIVRDQLNTWKIDEVRVAVGEGSDGEANLRVVVVFDPSATVRDGPRRIGLAWRLWEALLAAGCTLFPIISVMGTDEAAKLRHAAE